MIKINTSNSHSERFCQLFPRRILSYIDSSSNAFVGCTQKDKSESLRVISQQLQTKQSHFKSFEKPERKSDNCLSEVPFSLTHEESRENSISFTSREIRRSFLGTTCKIHSAFAMLRLGKQDDKGRL
ncbi:MAG: hypothetical protein DRI23_10365 [Candidatus Cloacimonadota bacterium]|nr:MAG: hypothetical protein DRI23_10365 [Candidatus Cloacimonadota bacterium]